MLTEQIHKEDCKCQLDVPDWERTDLVVTYIDGRRVTFDPCRNENP